MIHRFLAIIARLLVVAGLIVYTAAKDVPLALEMQDGSGHK